MSYLLLSRVRLWRKPNWHNDWARSTRTSSYSLSMLCSLVLKVKLGAFLPLFLRTVLNGHFALTRCLFTGTSFFSLWSVFIFNIDYIAFSHILEFGYRGLFAARCQSGDPLDSFSPLLRITLRADDRFLTLHFGGLLLFLLFLLKFLDMLLGVRSYLGSGASPDILLHCLPVFAVYLYGFIKSLFFYLCPSTIFSLLIALIVWVRFIICYISGLA